jgi:hypothetical protein
MMIYSPGRNTTIICRGKMHVVELHDDLFSWQKYNNYLHMSILHEYRCKDVEVN